MSDNGDPPAPVEEPTAEPQETTEPSSEDQPSTEDAPPSADQEQPSPENDAETEKPPSDPAPETETEPPTDAQDPQEASEIENAPEDAATAAQPEQQQNDEPSAEQEPQESSAEAEAEPATQQSQAGSAIGSLPNIIHKPFEKTLGIIKPGAMSYANDILSEVKKQGFAILQKRIVVLSTDLVSNLFGESVNESVEHMSQGPVMVFLIGKENAIEEFAAFCGPEDPVEAYETSPHTLRALFGSDVVQNAVYCSDVPSKVQSDIHLLFPDVVLEPIEVGVGVRDYLSENVMRTVIEGLTALCKAKPGSPIGWLGQWLIDNNPSAPTVTIPDE